MPAYTSSNDSRLEHFIRNPSPETVKRVDYIFVRDKNSLPDTIYAEILKLYRLKKRAEIRRQITSRKSVQEGAPDRIADLLEEAAAKIEDLEK